VSAEAKRWLIKAGAEAILASFEGNSTADWSEEAEAVLDAVLANAGTLAALLDPHVILEAWKREARVTEHKVRPPDEKPFRAYRIVDQDSGMPDESGTP
jgi:hypothetical protein